MNQDKNSYPSLIVSICGFPPVNRCRVKDLSLSCCAKVLNRRVKVLSRCVKVLNRRVKVLSRCAKALNRRVCIPDDSVCVPNRQVRFLYFGHHMIHDRLPKTILAVPTVSDFLPTIVAIDQENAAKIIMTPKKVIMFSEAFAVMLHSLSNKPIGPQFQPIPLKTS